MLKETDLISAKEMYKRSMESESSYERYVNNIIIGIEENSKKGYFEYTHWNKIPILFSSKISNWLDKLGYEYEFRESRNSSDIGLMELFIKWH